MKTISCGTILLVGILATSPAGATTCSQLNSECEAKGLTNVIVGAPSTAASEAKGLTNVIVGAVGFGSAKLLINVIVIPGTSGGIIPASPLTHFR